MLTIMPFKEANTYYKLVIWIELNTERAPESFYRLYFRALINIIQTYPLIS